MSQHWIAKLIFRYFFSVFLVIIVYRRVSSIPFISIVSNSYQLVIFLTIINLAFIFIGGLKFICFKNAPRLGTAIKIQFYGVLYSFLPGGQTTSDLLKNRFFDVGNRRRIQYLIIDKSIGFSLLLIIFLFSYFKEHFDLYKYAVFMLIITFIAITYFQKSKNHETGTFRDNQHRVLFIFASLSWGLLNIYTFSYIFQEFNVSITLYQIVFVVIVLTIAGNIPMAIGGIGIREYIMISIANIRNWNEGVFLQIAIIFSISQVFLLFLSIVAILLHNSNSKVKGDFK